jgi:hypothetical protein
VEQLLPIDFYSNLVGALVDQKVIQHLMQEQCAKLLKHLERWPELNMMLAQMVFKWLMCLFVGELPEETELLVWDLFFLKGSYIIYKVALTLIQIISVQILKLDKYNDIIMVLLSFG